ncbi:hypothetical protein VKT23_019027 [Stygiomarasmius scandens]|uniref:Uncharacterized protein n=1 Tax=Marasmiellus scandens TaxID=2682957 RepID=A0ABR1IMN5_9AGAR
MTESGENLSDAQLEQLWQINGGLAAQIAAMWLKEKHSFEVWDGRGDEEHESVGTNNSGSWCELEAPDLV